MNSGENVAGLILAQLAEWGVKRLYGVLGDAVFPLLDAVSRQERIKFISTAHEAGAAFMACAEARLTGRLAACAATSGPGAVNLLNGLADAFMDGVPVLAITGQVETGKMMAGTKQYFDQQTVFRNFTGQSHLAASPDTVADLLVSAARNACLKSLPAHISVPKDVFSQGAKGQPAPSGLADLRPPFSIAGSPEDAQAVMRSFRRPLVLAGQEARKVISQVVNLAEKMGAGLITALGVQGVAEDSHPVIIGGIGEAYLPAVVGEADGMVLIGGAPYEQQFLPAGAKIVHIHERPEKLYIKASSGAAGDMGRIIESLLRGMEGYTPDPGWTERVKQEALQKRQVVAADGENKSKPIHPSRLMADLSGVIPEDAVVALDIGEYVHWLNRSFTGGPREIIAPGLWRSTGCGLPLAAGAKFAFPDRTVVAIVGDGGMMASMGELLTCVRYGLAITAIVVKNGMYSLEKNKMIAGGLTPCGHELTTPDFVQFARACGAEGFRVEDPDSIRETVGSALALGRPALVEVVCPAVELPGLKGR